MKTNLSEILKANKAEIERLKTANKAANRLQSKVVRYTLDDLTAIQKCTTGKWFFESLLGDHSPYSPAPFDTAEEAIQHFEEIEPFTFGTKEPEPEQTRAEQIKEAMVRHFNKTLKVETDGELVRVFPKDESFFLNVTTNETNPQQTGLICAEHLLEIIADYSEIKKPKKPTLEAIATYALLEAADLTMSELTKILADNKFISAGTLEMVTQKRKERDGK